MLSKTSRNIQVNLLVINFQALILNRNWNRLNGQHLIPFYIINYVIYFHDMSIACIYRVMDARGKFGEHERSVRVARGDSREQL